MACCCCQGPGICCHEGVCSPGVSACECQQNGHTFIEGRTCSGYYINNCANQPLAAVSPCDPCPAGCVCTLCDQCTPRQTVNVTLIDTVDAASVMNGDFVLNLSIQQCGIYAFQYSDPRPPQLYDCSPWLINYPQGPPNWTLRYNTPGPSIIVRNRLTGFEFYGGIRAYGMRSPEQFASLTSGQIRSCCLSYPALCGLKSIEGGVAGYREFSFPERPSWVPLDWNVPLNWFCEGVSFDTGAFNDDGILFRVYG